jgi:hypothetical protein
MPMRRTRASMLGRQLVRQDGDEDQVVDAEHDFHDDQRDQGGPGGWVRGEVKEFVHRTDLSSGSENAPSPPPQEAPSMQGTRRKPPGFAEP